MKKKIIINIFLLFLFANFTFASNIINNVKNNSDFKITDEYIKLSFDFLKLNIGDVIEFGKYEQDANFYNGKENIEWILIDKNEQGLLLTTKYLLDCKPFNIFHRKVFWEDSSIRSWLNNEFYNNAFSNSEKELINTAYLINDENPYHKTFSGNNTYDKVFLLSISEVLNIYNKNQNLEISKRDALTLDIKKLCKPTQFAKNNGVRVNISPAIYNGCGNYFLRTAGLFGERKWYGNVTAEFYQSIITEDGRLSSKGTGVHSLDDGIRPCVYIKIN